MTMCARLFTTVYLSLKVDRVPNDTTAFYRHHGAENSSKIRGMPPSTRPLSLITVPPVVPSNTKDLEGSTAGCMGLIILWSHHV